MIPAGVPAWVRTGSHLDYGGHVNKVDFQGQGVVNALTDVGAAQFCRLASDLAAATRTAPFCVLSAVGTAVVRARLMTGVQTGDYTGSSPPAGFPSVVESPAGTYSITFASSYSDEYGVSGSYVPWHAVAGNLSSSARSVAVEIVGNIVVVRITDTAGAAVSAAKFSLAVY